MIDFSTFEAFEGFSPSLILDQHPDGKHLVMQVATADVFFAAIWNIETKRLVWFPEDAHGLAWLHQGTQIAALQNPILDEASFRFAIYSWPQGHLLQQCPLRFPMGYLFDLIISPMNDLAVCQWMDQCEFGFEFIALTDHSIAHLAQQGYINRKTNISTRTVFHPDGIYWVFCTQEREIWWTETSDDSDVPAHAGTNEIGKLILFHGKEELPEHIPLLATVPEGWLPEDPDTEEALYISDPVFLDAQHIMIRLPSGESQVHNVSRFLE